MSLGSFYTVEYGCQTPMPLILLQCISYADICNINRLGQCVEGRLPLRPRPDHSQHPLEGGE
jgi:hypothetical protein